MFCFIDIACYNRLTMTQKKLRKYAVVDLEATGAGPNASMYSGWDCYYPRK